MSKKQASLKGQIEIGARLFATPDEIKKARDLTSSLNCVEVGDNAAIHFDSDGRTAWVSAWIAIPVSPLTEELLSDLKPGDWFVDRTKPGQIFQKTGLMSVNVGSVPSTMCQDGNGQWTWYHLGAIVRRVSEEERKAIYLAYGLAP